MSRHPNSAYTPQAFGLSHRRTVTPQYSTARGYATALKNGATDSAQPKSKIPSKKAAPKASPGKVSSSGLKEVMRKQQMEAHKQETAKGQEAVARDEDATAHQEYMNRVTKQAPGLDLWTQADMDILGALVSTSLPREPVLILFFRFGYSCAQQSALGLQKYSLVMGQLARAFEKHDGVGPSFYAVPYLTPLTY